MKKPLFSPWPLFFAALLAFILGTLVRLRILPFLHNETILSPGKQVSTAEWAASASKYFYVGGGFAIVIGVVALFLTRRKPPDDHASTT
jgi:hypothetical protein